MESIDESKLTHIRNLVTLAYSDGKFNERERELIKEVGLRSGLKEHEVDFIIERPETIPFKAPANFRDKAEQFYDLVSIILTDDAIHDNELTICRLIAERIGFKPTAVDNVILDIKTYMDEGLKSQEILDRLKKYA